MMVTHRPPASQSVQPQEAADDLVSRGQARLLRALPRAAHPDHARRRHDALRGLLHVLDRLPRRVHHHRGGRRRADAREVPGALRHRSAALHLLRLLRRCLSRGCDLHDARLRDGHRHARAFGRRAARSRRPAEFPGRVRWAGVRTTARWTNAAPPAAPASASNFAARRSKTTRRRIRTSFAAGTRTSAAP